MAYTRHGHHISNTSRANYEAMLTPIVCGGPAVCTQCSQDVVRYWLLMKPN